MPVVREILGRRAMFGGWAVYCDRNVVALICDDRLFVKPTVSGRKMIKKEGLPYPGAKPYLLVEGELEDHERLCGLIRATAEELPEPKRNKTPRVKRIRRASRLSTDHPHS
jgi:TfoX/Sxy family transcriptional regulator of competence genes